LQSGRVIVDESTDAAGEVGVGVELVGDGKGGADFDTFLGKIVAVDENFADLVGVAGAVACFEKRA